VLQQHFDDLLAGDVVGGIEAELLEVLVLADQVGGRIGEQVEEAAEVGARGRVLEVIDDVELDAALAQEIQRAARLASALVVVNGDSRHGRTIARYSRHV
jgi:hypothetical protein